MTSRDLLQQRMTTSSGDTAWRLSALVTAALEGSLAVLDGLHRVNAGTFAVLHRSLLLIVLLCLMVYTESTLALLLCFTGLYC